MESYITVEKSGSSESIIKKSKFLGFVKPVKTVEEAEKFIEKIKKEHYNAKHHVPVYILDNGKIQKYSDDGEPQGTAGVPIIDILKAEKITDCVVVVVRYFGGILLGTGGLTRAYSETAKKALEDSRIIKMDPFKIIEFSLDYSLYGKLQNILDKYAGIIINSEFLDIVNLKISIPEENVEKFKEEIINLTSGKIIPAEVGSEYRKNGSKS